MARASKAKLYNEKSFSITFTSDIEAQLKAFADSVGDQVLRPAAFKAATVLYEEIHRNVPVNSGLLKSAIYRFREKQNTQYQSVFNVGVNKVKAPHWHWLEHGHWQVYQTVFNKETGTFHTLKNRPLATPVFIPAKPYLRPSFDSKYNEALKAGFDEINKRIKEYKP